MGPIVLSGGLPGAGGRPFGDPAAAVRRRAVTLRLRWAPWQRTSPAPGCAPAGGPGAARAEAPLLLVEPTGIPAETDAELRRLDPDEVYGEVIGRVSGMVEPSPGLPGQPDAASGVTGVAGEE